MSRRTIARHISVEGTALHAGIAVDMVLYPAEVGTGIIFRRGDLGVDIPARYDAVSETNLGTVIANGVASVGVVEHLMAAVAGAEIDDLLVTLDGPEPPILDGDALSYLELLDRAGFADRPASRTAIKVLKRVEYAHKNTSASLMPSDRLEYDFEIDFPTPAIGRQTFSLAFSPEAFRREIAPARTFGFVHELDALKKMDRGHGASLANTLAIDGDRVVNAGLMRFPERIRPPQDSGRHRRHGAGGRTADRAFRGPPLRPHQNNALLRALFADPANYTVVNLP